MRRLDRYVIKEMIVPLIAGTIIIAMLFVANELIRIFKDFDVRNVPMAAIGKIIVLRLPNWLVLTLPVGMALGSSLAIGRLSRESEVTALRAAGVPIRRLLFPIALVGLFVSFVNFYVVEKVMPPASKAYSRLIREIGMLSVRPTFKPNVVLTIDRYTVNIGAIQSREDGGIDLNDAWVMERPSANELTITHGETGEYHDGVWRLRRPTVYQIRGADVVSFDSPDDMIINQPIRIYDLFDAPLPEEETAATLKESIKKQREIGGNPRMLEVAYYVKFSIPASCLIFALTSAIMSVRVSRSGPFVGVLVSFGLVMLYYNMHIIATQVIGQYGWMNPMLSAWLPTILYSVMGLVALSKVE